MVRGVGKGERVRVKRGNMGNVDKGGEGKKEERTKVGREGRG